MTGQQTGLWVVYSYLSSGSPYHTFKFDDQQEGGDQMHYRQMVKLAVEAGALLLRRGWMMWAQSQWMLVLGGKGGGSRSRYPCTSVGAGGIRCDDLLK